MNILNTLAHRTTDNMSPMGEQRGEERDEAVFKSIYKQIWQIFIRPERALSSYGHVNDDVGDDGNKSSTGWVFSTLINSY